MANFVQVGDRFVNVDLIVSMYVTEIMIGSGKFCIVLVDLNNNKFTVEAGDEVAAFESLLEIVMAVNEPDMCENDLFEYVNITPRKEGSC